MAGPLSFMSNQDPEPSRLESSFVPTSVAMPQSGGMSSRERLSQIKEEVAPDEAPSIADTIKEARMRLLNQATGGVHPFVAYLTAKSRGGVDKYANAADAMNQAYAQRDASEEAKNLKLLDYSIKEGEARASEAKNKADEAYRTGMLKVEQDKLKVPKREKADWMKIVDDKGRVTTVDGNTEEGAEAISIANEKGFEVFNVGPRPVPKEGDGSKSPTQGQRQDTFNANRISAGLKNIGNVLKKDPEAATSVLLEVTSDIPLVSAVGKKFSNPNAQIVKNNMADVIDAIITLGTGAAYNKEQLAAERAKYMPQLGEPDEVKQSKINDLMDLYEFARERAGSDSLPDPYVFKNTYSSLFLKPDTTAPGADSPTQAPDIVLDPDVQAALDKHLPKNN
jgi:hypothetical protein